jgi:aspartate 1-decarboxylase
MCGVAAGAKAAIPGTLVKRRARMQLADLVIIAAFAQVDEAELMAGWKPDRVFGDEKNRI